MRKRIVVSLAGLAALLLFSPAASAQKLEKGKEPGLEAPEPIPGPGWKTCPRCQNAAQTKAAREKSRGHSFNPHDLSGVWGNNGVALDLKTLPPMTPYGQMLFDATQAEQLDPNIPAENGAPGTKDQTLRCDPLGYPRSLVYNYGFEFVHLPDRTIQFFQVGGHYRTIWTDGRKLPQDPPQLAWYGYHVGRWEGDTFVVESTGFDDRSWIDEDRRTHQRGFPHSDKMRLVERWKRPAYGTLELEVTITDPQVFTAPWVTKTKVDLSPGTELWESLCVPSDYEFYNTELTAGKHGSSSPSKK